MSSESSPPEPRYHLDEDLLARLRVLAGDTYKPFELGEDQDEFLREQRRAKCPACPALIMCQAAAWPDGAVYGCDGCHSIMMPTKTLRNQPVFGTRDGSNPLDYEAEVLVRCTASTMPERLWQQGRRHTSCNCHNRTRPLEGYDGIVIKEKP